MSNKLVCKNSQKICVTTVYLDTLSFYIEIENMLIYPRLRTFSGYIFAYPRSVNYNPRIEIIFQPQIGTKISTLQPGPEKHFL